MVDHVEITRNIAELYGQAVREARKAAGLSQTKLSKLAGVSDGRISQIERGLGSPTLATMVALAIALDFDSLEAPFGEPWVDQPTASMLRLPVSPDAS